MRAWLVVHAVVAVVATGAAVHGAVRTAAGWRASATWQPRRVRWHTTVAAVAYGATMATGLAIYPPYRLHVHAAGLDRHAPVLHALFEMKEHGAVAVAPLLLLWWLWARTSAEPDAWAVATASLVVALTVFGTLVGLSVVAADVW